MKICGKCGIVLNDDIKIKGKRICRNCQNNYSKTYYNNNSHRWIEYNELTDDEKVRRNEVCKNRILKNKEKYKEYQKKYRLENKESIKEKRKDYQKNVRYPRHLERMQNDEWYRSIKAYRSLLKTFIKRSKSNYIKVDKTSNILGYSISEFKSHIESMFCDGMNWFNHGKWHLDHIRPISSFEVGTDPSIVNDLKNLQPLWALENLIKSNNYES